MKDASSAGRWIAAAVEVAFFGGIGASLIRSGWNAAGVCVIVGTFALAGWVLMRNAK